VQTSRPYKVGRWRLDEPDDTTSEAVPMEVEGPLTEFELRSALHSRVGVSMFAPRPITILPGHESSTPSHDQTPLTPPSFHFPLSTDHLLHLIQYNVFRAFVSNKRTLNVLLTGWTDKPSSPTTCPIGGPYRDDTMVYPLNPNIPFSLIPTHLQQTRLHSLWINLIPFPRVRDNLIRREGSFDHWDFLQDLIGELMNFTPARAQRTTSYSFTVCDPNPKSASSLISKRDGDGLTAGRTGLIVWGEPHDMQNWEVTPSFLEKWCWAVEGCTELVECSNRWRRIRGEEAIHLYNPKFQLVS